MARPPAEVRFPGDKNRRKKVKVRGIKQASKQIQQRLEKDLDALLEDPKIFLPEIKAELGRPRRDMMAASLKEIEYVSKKRHDRKWLARRMVKRRGCMVSRALAGSLLAALDGDHSTVAVFNNPIYGTSSFIRRGNTNEHNLSHYRRYGPQNSIYIFRKNRRYLIKLFYYYLSSFENFCIPIKFNIDY